MSEERLIGWFVMMVNTYGEDAPAYVPTEVMLLLLERGWVEQNGEVNWEGGVETYVTAKGRDVFDLNAADWGVSVGIEA